MPIRRLPPETVNRIAAGEVVERPASAVKELVENALDAGALKIAIEADGGGLSRILIADDGSGMSPDDLSLAVERHATSKLSPQDDGSWDLLNISTMGFRGEALPSIGSVARLTIASRARGSADAHAILVEGGATGQPGPAAFPGPHGARVEVRDLFYATPARLKFMKSERAEQMAITRRASEDKTRFFAAASHDLRQPLHAIALFGAVLERELQGRAALTHAQRLMGAVRALGTSLDTMLDISRLDAGVIEAERRAFALSDVLTALLPLFASRAEEAGPVGGEAS